jgi:hypothetical protein
MKSELCEMRNDLLAAICRAEDIADTLRQTLDAVRETIADSAYVDSDDLYYEGAAKAVENVTRIQASLRAARFQVLEYLDPGELEEIEADEKRAHERIRFRDYTAADAAVDKADAANDEEWARRGRFCG